MGKFKIEPLPKIEEKIVGYSEAIIQELPIVMESKACLHIGVVYVEEDFRNKGIGKRLIKRMIQWGKELSVKEVNLNVHIKNPAAEIYEGMGFKRTRLHMTMRIK